MNDTTDKKQRVAVYNKELGGEEVGVYQSDSNTTPYHRHTFLEIAYVEEGSALHYFDNRSVIVKKGDYYAIDYHEVHKYSPNGNDNFKIINCLFRPEFIDVSLKHCKGFSDLVSNYLIKFEYARLKTIPTKIVYHDENGEVYALFKKMYREFFDKKPRYQEIIRCHIIELIIITLRKIYEETENQTSPLVAKVLGYIDKNYNKPITLSKISAALGYSLPYLSSLFGKEMSVSFGTYLQKKRIEQACHMLANTHTEVSEISNLVGYSDVKHFRAVFKRMVGKSPSEFRGQYQQKDKSPCL